MWTFQRNIKHLTYEPITSTYYIYIGERDLCNDNWWYLFISFIFYLFFTPNMDCFRKSYLDEANLTSTHNLCFSAKISKMIYTVKFRYYDHLKKRHLLKTLLAKFKLFFFIFYTQCTSEKRPPIGTVQKWSLRPLLDSPNSELNIEILLYLSKPLFLLNKEQFSRVLLPWFINVVLWIYLLGLASALSALTPLYWCCFLCLVHCITWLPVGKKTIGLKFF